MIITSIVFVGMVLVTIFLIVYAVIALEDEELRAEHLKRCKYCGTITESDAQKCSHCGRKFK